MLIGLFSTHRIVPFEDHIHVFLPALTIVTNSMASSPNSSAPYYYSELKGGKKLPEGGLILPGPGTLPTGTSNLNGTLGRNGNIPLTNGNGGVNNNPGGNGPYASEAASSGRTSAGGMMHATLTDESPSSSSVSSSRPSSSRELQQPFAAHSTYGTIGGNSPSGFHGAGIGMQAVPPPAAFANPLLGMEPDTRGSESLPRSFRQQKPTIAQKVASKQGIYQRSLSLLANGVSPLLRKKHSNSNSSSSGASKAPPPAIIPPQDTLLNSSLARRRRKSEPIVS